MPTLAVILCGITKAPIDWVECMSLMVSLCVSAHMIKFTFSAKNAKINIVAFSTWMVGSVQLLVSFFLAPTGLFSIRLFWLLGIFFFVLCMGVCVCVLIHSITYAIDHRSEDDAGERARSASSCRIEGQV